MKGIIEKVARGDWRWQAACSFTARPTWESEDKK